MQNVIYIRHLLYLAVYVISGNPYPPVLPRQRDKSHNLLNQLLAAAEEDFRQQKLNEKLRNMKISMVQIDHLNKEAPSEETPEKDSPKNESVS